MQRTRAAPGSGSTTVQCVTAGLPLAFFDEKRLRSVGWRACQVRDVPLVAAGWWRGDAEVLAHDAAGLAAALGRERRAG